MDEATGADAGHVDRTNSAAFARLSRDSVIFALGSVAGKLVALVTLPIFTRLMAPEDYGRLDLLSTLGSAVISVLSLGMDVAAIRLAMDPNRHPERRKATLGAWVVVAFLVSGSAAVAALLGASAISNALFGDTSHSGAVALLALIVGAGVLQIQGLTLLRIQGRPKSYSGIVTGALVLNAALGIALLILWTRDERAPLLALGVSWAVGAAGAAMVAGRGAIGRPRPGDLRELLVIALPLVPALLATWVAEFGNRAILLGGAGAAELGYLAIGIRLASIGGLVVVGFQLAWQPRALSLDTSPAGLERFVADAQPILLICSVVVAAVGLIAPEMVLLWSGPSYAASLPVTGVCLIGTIGTAAILVASVPSFLRKWTFNLTIAGVVGAALGLGLDFLAAPRFGAEGSAASIALGQATTAIIAWQLGTRGLQMPHLWRQPIVAMALAGAIALVATLPPGGAPIWIRALLAAAAAILIWRDATLRTTIRALRSAV